MSAAEMAGGLEAPDRGGDTGAPTAAIPSAWPILHDGPEPEYDPDEEWAVEHAEAWDGYDQ